MLPIRDVNSMHRGIAPGPLCPEPSPILAIFRVSVWAQEVPKFRPWKFRPQLVPNSASRMGGLAVRGLQQVKPSDLKTPQVRGLNEKGWAEHAPEQSKEEAKPTNGFPIRPRIHGLTFLVTFTKVTSMTSTQKLHQKEQHF